MYFFSRLLWHKNVELLFILGQASLSVWLFLVAPSLVIECPWLVIVRELEVFSVPSVTHYALFNHHSSLFCLHNGNKPLAGSGELLLCSVFLSSVRGSTLLQRHASKTAESNLQCRSHKCDCLLFLSNNPYICPFALHTTKLSVTNTHMWLSHQPMWISFKKGFLKCMCIFQYFFHWTML